MTIRPPEKRGRTPLRVVLLLLGLAALGVLLLAQALLFLAAGREEGPPAPVGSPLLPPPYVPPRAYLERAARLEAPSYPAQCRLRHHGLEYLEELRTSQEPVCARREGGALGSEVSCSFQHEGLPEAFCAGRNLALDLNKLYPILVYGDPSNITFTPNRGLLVGDCLPPEPGAPGAVRWKTPSFGDGAQRWVYYALADATTAGVPPPRCVAWVEHPLYFVGRMTGYSNAWHGLEDLSHAFETYSLLGWGEEAQMVLVDEASQHQMFDGKIYGALWRKGFSPLHQATTLRQLVLDIVRATRKIPPLPEGSAICFREASWNVNGRVSLFSRSSRWTSPCLNSTTVGAFVTFILDRLDLQHVLPLSHSAGGSGRGSGSGSSRGSWFESQVKSQRQRPGGLELLGLWPRRPMLSVVWAMRRFRARSMGEQRELVRRLGERLQAAGAEVTPVLFEGAIVEQICTARMADVLVGFHGAGLIQSLWMPRESALVEVELEPGRCNCFGNAAIWRGRPYFRFKDRGKPTDDFFEDLARVVGEAVELVWQRLAAVAAGVDVGAAPTVYEIEGGAPPVRG